MMRSQTPNPIAQLNQLDHHDWLEAEPLIFECFEHGLFQWTNPKFLYFLDNVVTGLLTLHRHEHRQLRGVVYARVVEELMPVGIDDDLRGRLVAISDGKPQPKLVKETVIPLGQPKSDGKVWHGPCCVWPSPRGKIWSQAFWIHQERFVNSRLSLKLMRQRTKISRQQAS